VISVHPGGSSPSNRRHLARDAARGVVSPSAEGRELAATERYHGAGSALNPITKAQGRRLLGGVRWPYEQREAEASGHSTARRSPEMVPARSSPERRRPDPREEIARVRLESRIALAAKPKVKRSISNTTLSTTATTADIRILTPSTSERDLAYPSSERSLTTTPIHSPGGYLASPGPSGGSLTPGFNPLWVTRRLPKPSWK